MHAVGMESPKSNQIRNSRNGTTILLQFAIPTPFDIFQRISLEDYVCCEVQEALIASEYGWYGRQEIVVCVCVCVCVWLEAFQKM